MIDLWKIKGIQDEVFAELIDATSKYGSFRSAHEGYAVIKEEVDELWDEVKRQHRSEEAMYKEAIQIAAMAVRFLYDLRDIQRRGEVESGNAHSADPEPPATQRTSQLGDRPILVAVPRREWPGDASPQIEPDPSDPARVIVRHRPGPNGEGHQDQSAGRLQPKLLSSPDSDQQLRHLEQLQSLVPQEEEGQGR